MKNFDYLVTKNKDTVFCTITGIKGKRIEYIKNGDRSSTKENIFHFLDVNITDLSIVENPLSLKIESPERGYAFVYFYRPYVYTGSALNCKIEYNGKHLINLKTNSYYLHKVKANETLKYNWNNNKREVLEITANEGEIYFIRGSFDAEFLPWNKNTISSFSSKDYTINTFPQVSNGSVKLSTSAVTFSNPTISNSMSIFIDNPKIAKYLLLTMSKISPSY